MVVSGGISSIAWADLRSKENHLEEHAAIERRQGPRVLLLRFDDLSDCNIADGIPFNIMALNHGGSLFVCIRLCIHGERLNE